METGAGGTGSQSVVHQGAQGRARVAPQRRGVRQRWSAPVSPWSPRSLAWPAVRAAHWLPLEAEAPSLAALHLGWLRDPSSVGQPLAGFPVRCGGVGIRSLARGAGGGLAGCAPPSFTILYGGRSLLTIRVYLPRCCPRSGGSQDGCCRRGSARLELAASLQNEATIDARLRCTTLSRPSRRSAALI